MPTDLTGAPTSLGIGTYNVDVDAPSGLGFNAAMAQIDAIIAARISSTPSLGDAMVYSGSAWVKSSTLTTQRLNIGGSSQPKITTSALSGGPPASPQDGDIWVATGVDTATRWVFQYNSAAPTFKWEFIGGPQFVFLNVSGFTSSNGGSFVSFPTPASFTATRAGIYETWMGVLGTTPASVGLSFGVAPHINGVSQGNQGQTSNVPASSNWTVNSIPASFTVAGAGQVLEWKYFSNLANSIAGYGFYVVPKAVI